MTLNPVNPDLLARANNRLVDAKQGATTSDRDIERRRWLLIDLDPERPSGISSTETEHQAAIEKAREIASWLESSGFPPAILADSGNGAHLLYQVDLPPDDNGLLNRVLKALDARFSDETVKVDVTTFNPARICKLYGTPARKGDSTPDRPHRLSRILEVPEELEHVPKGRLEEIAAFMDAHFEQQTHETKRGAFDVRARLAQWDCEVVREEPYQDGNRLVLRQCPFGEHRKEAKAAVFVDGGGRLGFHCFSNDHAGLGWRDLREKREPGYTAARDGASVETKEQADSAAPAAPAERDWPEPPALDAFHGLAGEFVALVKPQTEADPAALLVQFLVLFGNLVGHGPQRLVGGQAHHLNEYVVIVGPTKSGRKGTSYAEVERFFRLVDRGWLDARKSGGLVSGEGLIWAVRDQIVKKVPITPNETPAVGHQRKRKKKSPAGDGLLGRATDEPAETVKDEPTERIIDEGIADKRLPVVETEYSATLKAASRDGSTLSDVMRKAWDGSVLGTLSKNNPARATGAHISIIGHITPDELLRNLDSTEAANGFGNRHLWCASRRQQELPWGGSVQHEQMNDLATRVHGAAEQAKCIGEFDSDFDESAAQLWEKVYHDLSADRPGLLGAMIARAEAHVLRLTMIYAALDSASTIREPHLKAALAVWAYCVRSAEYFFGDRLGDPIADTVIEALRNHPAGLTTTEIHGLFSRNVKASQVQGGRGRLLQYGRIRIEREESGGRPVERWRLI